LRSFCFAKTKQEASKMLLMVHGFFGKFAQKELAPDDVIEIKISDEAFYPLVDATAGVSVINEDEQLIVNEIVTLKSNVLPCKILPIFQRAIIRRCNFRVILTEEKHELESIALVIKTAQRYERDVYFI
jgi:hypothetical protein